MLLLSTLSFWISAFEVLLLTCTLYSMICHKNTFNALYTSSTWARSHWPTQASQGLIILDQKQLKQVRWIPSILTWTQYVLYTACHFHSAQRGVPVELRAQNVKTNHSSVIVRSFRVALLLLLYVGWGGQRLLLPHLWPHLLPPPSTGLTSEGRYVNTAALLTLKPCLNPPIYHRQPPSTLLLL